VLSGRRLPSKGQGYGEASMNRFMVVAALRMDKQVVQRVKLSV